MSTALTYADAMYAVLRRDFRLELSYRVRFIARFASVFFSLTLFYYVSRLIGTGFASPDEYYAFAVIGIVVLQVLNATLVMPPMLLRQELVAGTWEKLVVSPLGPIAGTIALMVWPFVLAAVGSVITIAFATLVFGIPFAWETAPLAVPVAVLATVAFMPFGVLLVGAVLAAKQAMAGPSFIITAVSLVGGLYFPVALLPGWIQWMSEVQPFTPAAELMRHLLLGNPLIDPAWVSVAKLTLFAAVLLPISLYVLSLVLRRTRRTGTIVEY